MSNFTIDVNIHAPELSRAICILAAVVNGTPPRQEHESVPAPAPPVEPKPEPEPVPEPAPTAASAPVVPLETVRAKLAALSQAGKQAQVKSLISKFGAKKLTDIPADRYGELLEAAGSL